MPELLTNILMCALAPAGPTRTCVCVHHVARHVGQQRLAGGHRPVRELADVREVLQQQSTQQQRRQASRKSLVAHHAECLLMSRGRQIVTDSTHTREAHKLAGETVAAGIAASTAY